MYICIYMYINMLAHTSATVYEKCSRFDFSARCPLFPFIWSSVWERRCWGILSRAFVSHLFSFWDSTCQEKHTH